MADLHIFTDGGARGNPGPAAIGVVFCDEDGQELHSYKETIGVATNNQAEYQAIIKALDIASRSKWHKQNPPEDMIVCHLDSMLVVEQINGNYKVKNDEIKLYMIRIRELLDTIQRSVSFQHIPREKNKKADKLVNKALDESK